MQITKTWYTKSFAGGSKLRPLLTQATTIDELSHALSTIPGDTPFPLEGLRARRAKRSGRQKVTLPDGWLAGDTVEEVDGVGG